MPEPDKLAGFRALVVEDGSEAFKAAILSAWS
jgi:hypothetical protein